MKNSCIKVFLIQLFKYISFDFIQKKGNKKMKKLIIINGTMGVGKSTVSELLLKEMENSVYLDGDWCWNMNPFTVNEENIEMVLKNIIFLLRSFLNNSNFQYVIFCWVIHKEEILKNILYEIGDLDFELFKFTLLCNETELAKRIAGDIKTGKRKTDQISESISRLELYKNMDTYKIDVTNRTSKETMEEIRKTVKLQ